MSDVDNVDDEEATLTEDAIKTLTLTLTLTLSLTLTLTRRPRTP